MTTDAGHSLGDQSWAMSQHASRYTLLHGSREREPEEGHASKHNFTDRRKVGGESQFLLRQLLFTCVR